MPEVLSPREEKEVADLVAAANRSKEPLAIVGGGTRASLGRPTQTAATLSTARLKGVTLYEPAELVLSARAGTPLAEIDALLAENGQRLPFEPMDHRQILGSSNQPTIGGIVAANVSGPRRIQAGAARDSLIGLRAVTGRGDVVKSGGRVMKNVTGYDLVKFLAGSYGTLAVLSEVTFKVLPAPETESTLIFSGLDDEGAVAAMSTALGSPFSVTGAAHHAAYSREPARTFVRLDGFYSSVSDRTARLADELAGFGPAEHLDGGASAQVWRAIRDVEYLGFSPKQPIWRISTRPTDAPATVATIRQSFDCRTLYDWGGGLVWLAGGEGDDGGAAVVRAAVAAVGGHATLVRAARNIRATVPVFQPLDPALMLLTRRLKQTFDPVGVLNPGRMYEGI
jgi:glycolate oxidase FAD binding subunit